MAKPIIRVGTSVPPTSRELEAQARANTPADVGAFSAELAAAREREANQLADPTGNTPTQLPAPPQQDSRSFTDRLTQLNQALSRGPHYRKVFEINSRNEQVMTWRLPNGGVVQMYINPQNFVVRESKQITETRTKGGFVVQYWGENLTQLTLSGTTGSSGIKGINVLRDIYRSENRGFDLIASQLAGDLLEVQSALSSGDQSLNSLLTDTSTEIQKRNFLLRPSLAALATSVLLFYQGVQYKGYFKDFTVTESVSKLGLFDYNITFTATETRGSRKNFMAWHKEPQADDIAGQLINGIGNAIRGAFGLGDQPPESFHPANAPYTFGGSSLSGILDMRSSATIGGFAGVQSSRNSEDIFI